MIEKMSKLTLLMPEFSLDETLRKLQSLGVVHIDRVPVKDEELLKSFALLKEIDTFLADANASAETSVTALPLEEVHQALSLYTKEKEKINSLEGALLKVKALHLSMQPWGEFNGETISKLHEAGVFVQAFSSSLSDFQKLERESEHHIELVAEHRGTAYFVVISNSPVEFSFEVVDLKKSSQELLKGTHSLENEIKKHREELQKLYTIAPRVEMFRRELMKSYTFGEVKGSVTTHFDTIISVVGWIPTTLLAAAETALSKTDSIYYEVEKNIAPEDFPNVPIKLKNSWFAEKFEIITKLFALPSYTEIDPTPFFAPFFIFFFGLCLGDFGYGFAMMIASVIAMVKLPKLRSIFLLVFFFSLTTMFWGALGGVTFGMDTFKVHIPVLSSLAYFTSEHMFYLALLIGLFQIFFGMAIQVVNRAIKISPLASLSTLGWMIMIFCLVAMYLTPQNPTGNFTIGNAFIAFCQSIPAEVKKYGAILGVVLILFFNDIHASIPMRIGKGLWELYGITGFLGDLLSYIRLFALGVSSAILGTIINSMSAEILKLPIPVLPYILYVAFLVVGHTSNLLLSSLGSFVHPLRLTFVEFYRNVGFEGGGKNYDPFKE